MGLTDVVAAGAGVGRACCWVVRTTTAAVVGRVSLLPPARAIVGYTASPSVAMGMVAGLIACCCCWEMGATMVVVGYGGEGAAVPLVVLFVLPVLVRATGTTRPLLKDVGVGCTMLPLSSSSQSSVAVAEAAVMGRMVALPPALLVVDKAALVADEMGVLPPVEGAALAGSVKPAFLAQVARSSPCG